MTITPYENAPLTEAEVADLTQLEEIIAPGLQTFYLTGAALATIRDTRLYRATYPTFEHYCEGRWDLKRRRAYQLIEAAEVVSNVQKITQIAPANEAQARSLATLPPEDQPVVFQEALDTAPNGKMSVPHIERTRERLYRVESHPAPYDLSEGDPEPESSSVVLHADAVIIPLNPHRLSPAQIEAAQPAMDALIADPEYRNGEIHHAFKDVLHRLHQVKAAARLLVRHVSPEEMAAILSEYDMEEEGRLMPTVAWVGAVFAARRETPNIRRVK